MGQKAADKRYHLARACFRNSTAFRADGIIKISQNPKAQGSVGGEGGEGVIAISTEKELIFLVFTLKDNFLCFAPVNRKKL